jgi:Putative  PD-(D/E)XK family member, (DUF4420)
MDPALGQLFASITPPSGGDPDKPLYSVKPDPACPSHYIGKDKESLPCLLIATARGTARSLPPIRLENLDVHFDLACHVKRDQEPEFEAIFTVIRCRDPEKETVRYFLSVCETILRILGDLPARTAIAAVVNRLATIFNQLQQPPTRSLNGLFGELFLIRLSANPRRALSAWRIDDRARFDFSDGDARLEVKTASNRLRAHSFSYEQCNAPAGTLAVVASLFVERAAAGIAFRALINEIEHRLAGDADLIFKLHDIVAATLGTGLREALPVGFDEQLAGSSLQFFELDQIPAIRGNTPAGVSEVRFRSDLSAMTPISPRALIDRDPVFWDLLPKTSDTGE